VSEEVRMWEILGGESLKEISRTRLGLESRIEDWLARDISILSDDLLVVGRQIQTVFGGIIDLLCLDWQGDVTIVELKRDKTPRQITAQTLDYASWVKDLSNDNITGIANTYLEEKGPLEEAFVQRFGIELPEALNEHHNMLIVASQVDSSSERIIRYLSDTYGVGINVATFGYFRNDNGQEFLARVFLIEPERVEMNIGTQSPSKRSPPLTDVQARVRAIVEDLIREHPRFGLDKRRKNSQKFGVTDWDTPALLSAEDWPGSRRILRFVFHNKARSLDLQLALGPGPDETRQRILAMARANSDIFMIQRHPPNGTTFTLAFFSIEGNTRSLIRKSVKKRFAGTGTSFLTMTCLG